MTGVTRANLSLSSPDGARLAFDVYVPANTTAAVPTVVTRTPYGRSVHREEGEGWARRGFAFVAADVRGRYDSDGTWQPYRQERNDGALLADWIVGQSWSDGRIVAYGGSYSGYTAWALAAERPDAVAAVVSLGPSMSLARTKFSPAGMLRLAEHAAWWAERADARTSRDGYSAAFFAAHPDALCTLPVLGIDLGVELPGWASVISDGPWAITGEELTDAELRALEIPSLHVGGWHDLLLEETLQHWAIRSAGPLSTPAHLVIGPWLHDLAFSTDARVGDLDYGPAALRPWGAELVDWLRGALDGTLEPRLAQVFLRGENRWCSAESWPPASSVTPFWSSGDRLVTVPETGSSREFGNDPADPYPSLPEGRDRAVLDGRPDAVRYESEKVDAPLRIAGRAQVRFVGETDGASADWIARLLVASPDGRLIELAAGEATTDSPGGSSSRDSDGGRGFTAPVEITLSPVDAVVGPGSRIRLELTGADFPRLARNLGVRGTERYLSTAGLPLLQRVLGGTQPVLLLPLASVDAEEARR